MRTCRVNNSHSQRACLGIVIAAVGIINLGGCKRTPPEMADCEAIIQRKLLAPTTYRRISADSLRMDDLKPPAQWVVVEYDASNAYGVPVRERKICKYRLLNGAPDIANYTEADSAVDIEPDNLEVVHDRETPRDQPSTPSAMTGDDAASSPDHEQADNMDVPLDDISIDEP